MSEEVSRRPGEILTYDGNIGDLYRIFLVNLLLTIITLGVWRFWATTRLRRYIWSRTSSGGERFEYDGTGGQLFVGFLMAIGLLVGLFIAAILLRMMLHPIGPILAFVPLALTYLAFFVLALGAPFSAQRYRLNHTIWRGIRGGMEGSMIGYGLRSLLYNIAAVLTLYQLRPWIRLRLLECRVNASSFGTLRFTLHGRAGNLYVRFLLTFLAAAVFTLVVFGLFFTIEWPLFRLMTGHSHNPVEQQVLIRRLTIPLLVGYLIFGFGLALIRASFQVAFYRHVAGHATLATLQFASDLNTIDMVKLIIGNILILIFTLGLGQPVVIHRNARFLAAHLLAAGTLDLSQIGQSLLPISRFGEGMFQALDAGAGAL